MGARLRYTYEVAEHVPGGFSRFVAPMMAPAMRRANRKDLQRLKSRLEAS